MVAGVRKSALAGSWYPGSARILREDIEGFLRRVPGEEIGGDVIGLVVPHAGYVYSGPVAAYAYQAIRDRIFDHVLVIGPSHHAFFHGVSLYGRGGYETPLGVVPVDEVLADKIAAAGNVVASLPETHAQEHSIEIQLPFLQVVLARFQFVPLLMGEQDMRTCQALADAVVGAVGAHRVLIVGSSDLSHFHPYEQALAMDGRTLRHLEQMDAAGLLADVEEGKSEACGGGPAAVTILAARRLGADAVRVLKYANSGDVTGDRRSVVGYAAAVFYRSDAVRT